MNNDMNKRNDINNSSSVLPNVPIRPIMPNETENINEPIVPIIPTELSRHNSNSNNNPNGQKCTIAIIDGNKIRNICLNDFQKSIITFGRSENNDIILSSPLVSRNHGYFNFSNNMVLIFDN